eukprot:jgi/Bigna1/50911/estExt_Genewise1.C_990072
MSMFLLSTGQALLGFAALTFAHIPIILANRSYLIHTGQRKPNQFEKSRSGSENTFASRVGMAHANCVENLVLFASVLLCNRGYGGAQLDTLASYYLYARICQSVTHWISVSETAIVIRFLFFLPQIVILAIMGYKTFITLR